MLRASAHQTGRQVELSAIVHPDRDSVLPAGRQLLEFVTALILGSDDDLSEARGRLVASVGDGGVVRTAAVAGTFQMMNRLVDATGVPIGATMKLIADDLGLGP
jgi:hypothetical protein